MDWSKTKTIFIVTFLLLNAFLGYQLYDKTSHDNINVLISPALQERLEENDIKIDISNAEDILTGAPITGRLATFDEEYLRDNLLRQEVKVVENTMIHSEMDRPYKMVDSNIPANVNAFLGQYVYLGEEYEFADYNEEENYIGLYQTYKGRKIDQYERSDYHIILNLNDDFHVESYTQKYMEITEQENRQQDLLSPLKAVERLLNQQYLATNTVIKQAQLGYYSLIQPDESFQVFVPVWRIQANEDYFYVDALNGEIQSMN
ncbi:two-component system regulatory protein YycI [Salipaludibacillus sp. LMS25]|jgi:regulatory protein YycI of two-component signal transduction system YycFG|uniref:two-component system regulatory protein YycI n=1 Tax=Salipaludibacillus sp. LMS25 TaxID=2924031 RepID=UPI0020D11A9B|nr:two-component system regulatory protein YycI [Salipaludibacillus sp. LMS25]UTR16557.1 two-component system regulatory protein YycI [Salipaludibacillus sp. LMS25]